MKKFSILKFLILGILVSGAAYLEAPGQKIRLRAQITPSCSSGTSRWKFSDIFADGNIAVQGSYNCRGAFVYDISNPDAPTLASWYNPGNNQQFLEAIFVGNRGYFGSGNGGGVHIVDLTNPANPQLLGTVNSTAGNGHNSIHEMMVITQNGQTYLIENSNSLSNKIIKFINVTNPAAPVFVRDLNPTEAQWVHAMHIRGNRMIISGWGNTTNRGRTEIYDISNIATQAPSLLGFVEDTTATTAGNNMHSSWTSEDGGTLYSARETTNGTGDIRVYDITTPGSPTLVDRQTMTGLELNAVTPHNPVVFGNKLYVSWYQAGLQVFDISIAQQPRRIGQYDSYQQTFAPTDLIGLSEEPWDIVCGSENLQNVLPTSYDGAWAVFPFLGEDKVLIGDLTNGLLVVDVSRANAPLRNTVSDFDGDGKTDLSTFTPASGVWSVEQSSDAAFAQTTFGIAGDQLTTGDFDGDGRSDISLWRPSNGNWYRINSANNTFYQVQFGLSGDRPVEADYDADGKADVAVWRPSTGTWFIMRSTLGIQIQNWGISSDVAFAGDYEGDGKADMTIFRPSTGTWYVMQSSSSIPIIVNWGIPTDKPLSADFDGDGKSDFAVYRPAEGNWYVLKSATNEVLINRFGLANDVPVPADFDGDGKADIAVFRPDTAVWYRLNSTNGAFSARSFGQTGDTVSPSSVQP